MKSTRVYNFSIPAGGSFQLPVTGSYFRVMTATDMLEVQGDTFGNIYPLYTGQGLQGQEFRSLNLLNRSGATNNGSILVSDGKFVDDRITGSVEVIDGGKNRTLSGQAFINAVNIISSGGTFCTGGLWNPINSLKNLIIEKISFSSAITNNVAFGSVTETTNLNISGHLNSKKTNSNIISNSLRLDGSIIPMPIGFNYFGIINTVSNTSYIYDFKEPIIITPGYGFVLRQGITNDNFNYNIECFEEAIL